LQTQDWPSSVAVSTTDSRRVARWPFPNTSLLPINIPLAYDRVAYCYFSLVKSIAFLKLK